MHHFQEPNSAPPLEPVAIDTIEVLGGSLPNRALALVRDWGSLHRGELEANWEHARDERPLERIDPLP